MPLPATIVLGTFAASIFLSAALLFAVQPLFAKMVLPRLGGSPAVWSVAMVFFQTVLLAGYAYAHFLTRTLSGRRGALLHVALLIAATLALPLSIAAGWGRPPDQGHAFWLLGLFAVSIGLPFLALSANGPLLQAWFARTDHPAAKDPYFLYAASNAGSFLALLAYPFAIEPFSRLGRQIGAWSAGFYVLIVLIAACGLMIRRGALPAVPRDGGRAPAWRERAAWVALATVPSGLLIAVTAHISTDIAAAPFLWVIPLTLYLVTFVIAFQRRPLLPRRFVMAATPVVIVLLVMWYVMEPSDEIFYALAVNLLGFFTLAMVCHGELASRRPAPSHLTEFYLWLSLGGVIGGVFAGLIALQLFSRVTEYPLLIVLAALCRPGAALPRGRAQFTFLAAVAVVVAIVFAAGWGWNYEFGKGFSHAVIAAILVLAFAIERQVVNFAVLIAAVFILDVLFSSDVGRPRYVRSFFGVHKVAEANDGQFRVLFHGVTEHGAQRIRDAAGNPVGGRPEPLTYYYEGSPLHEGIVAMRERRGGPIRLGVVGLGTGSLACWAQPGDRLQFYEIDPAVIAIARKHFTFLSACAADARIVTGDARLTLEDAADGQFDVLVIDAFSSDAIPTHLLTKEAMAIFARKIASDGIVLIHVSNQHMVLAPVVAGIARANGLVSLGRDVEYYEDEDSHKYAPTVVAVARREADFGSLMRSDEWHIEEPVPGDWVWTDDYSNVLGAMIQKRRQ